MIIIHLTHIITMENKSENRLDDQCIRFDWAIRQLLREKANFGVLEGFLTVFLGEKITLLEIPENEDNPLPPGERLNRIVIKARNSRDETILIEIQNLRKLHYFERLLYGVPNALPRREACRDVKKIYSISILYFDIGKGNDYLYYGGNDLTGAHTGDPLELTIKEKSVIITPRPADTVREYVLIRLNAFEQNAVTPLEEWMTYLKTGIIRFGTTAPGLGEARGKLSYFAMTSPERRAYEEYLNAIMIQNDVLDTARLEGRIMGRNEVKTALQKHEGRV